MSSGSSWCRILLAAAVLVATAVPGEAADLAPSATTLAGALLRRQTLTDDWFGQGPAMRAAGVDLRLEWSQFYQGLTQGDGDKT